MTQIYLACWGRIIHHRNKEWSGNFPIQLVTMAYSTLQITTLYRLYTGDNPLVGRCKYTIQGIRV
uniref:Uncharacterized protein n=1 Tax=Setaria italica TaxID=4555 RepID=K4A3V2_SETIT